MKNKIYKKNYIERSIKLPIVELLERFEFGPSGIVVDGWYKMPLNQERKFNSYSHKMIPFYKHNTVMQKWGSRGGGFKKLLAINILNSYSNI